MYMITLLNANSAFLSELLMAYATNGRVVDPTRRTLEKDGGTHTMDTPAERLRHGLNERVREIETQHREKSTRAVDVCWRLQDEYGLGDAPVIRARLYAAVGCICKYNGPKATKLLNDTIAESRSKSFPDRWFAAVIMDRFAQRGFQLPGYEERKKFDC